ncbi:hypothetical protein Q4575_17045 [Psychrosphaera sp. 1_MG-2023]|uniref:hypothetical protein n=1 Tax=Psychrosphaera sp. 1_MG-2023 TaxID=3062643 RepID=UPI0026E33441|nr:hypothetical protein [Psychrosphaera sp. 1_MG-2023]MDO6721120.1 hypothetical protein [Psychrosphaera sp. 1_MG-2023]
MDPQFESWQNAFKQATPKIDVDKLLSQVKASKFRQQLKAYTDMLVGVAVSAYSFYAALWLADSMAQTMLFITLTPIPIAFSVWSFGQHSRLWQQQTLDISALLAFKRDELVLRLKYWRISTRVCIILYVALAIIACVNYLLYDTVFVWLVQLGINGAILSAVILRYRYLEQHLPQKLKEIDDMGKA